MTIRVPVAAACAALFLGSVTAALGETRFEVDLPGPAASVVLEASVLNGALQVSPSEGNRLVVVIDEPAAPLEVTSEAGSWVVPDIGLVVETQDNRAVLKTRWTRPLALRLLVPQRAMLKLEMVMGGDLFLDQMQGAIEVRGNNSNVRAAGVHGPIVVSSVQGSIDVEFARVDAAAAASLVTWSGDVAVRLAPGVGLDLRLKTVRGEVDSDVPLAASALGPNPRRRSELQGRVGSGGADLRMESYSGRLIVRLP